MIHNILFSLPTPEVLDQIKPYLFSKEIGIHKVALMLSEGDLPSELEFLPFWQNFFKENQIQKYEIVDNSKLGAAAKKECEKLRQSNILMICGGNTFSLMNNLHRSGLDQEIKDFYNRGGIVAGFSAGAIVQTPSIKLASSPDDDGSGDENKIGLKDFTGLNLVPFEVYVHYQDKYKKYMEHYRKQTNNQVKVIRDDELLVV
jgi:peptidase E